MALSRKQIEAFAAGLYHLAKSDGVERRELDIIDRFCADAGYPGMVDSLAEIEFDPVEAYRILEGPWLRKLFLRAAVLVVRSDRIISQGESEAMAHIARAWGIEDGLHGILEEVEQPRARRRVGLTTGDKEGQDQGEP